MSGDPSPQAPLADGEEGDLDGLYDRDGAARAARAAEAVRAIATAQELRGRLDRLSRSQAPLARAVAATARLCEATARSPQAAHLVPWFLRGQALAVVAGEGIASDEAKFLALAAGDPSELTSKAEWTAADVLRATEVALSIDPDTVGPGDVLGVWIAAERSNRRLESATLQWRLEQDSDHFAREIANLAASRTPAGAAEIFRRLMAGGTFDGKGRRMALILAPLVVRTGFGAPRALVGLAGPLARAPAAFSAAADDEEEFASLFYEAVASEARRGLDALSAYARIEEDLSRLLPRGRSTGRTRQAMSALMSQPVITAVELARILGATPKGGQLIMDRMVSAGVAALMGTGRSKGRLYVCRRAMGVSP